MKQRSIKKIPVILVFLLLFCFNSASLAGVEVAIPGNIYKLSHFVDFQTTGSEKDFLYHFNEMLLNAESPNGKLIKNGFRQKLFRMFDTHEKIKKAITGINGNEDFLSVRIKIDAPEGFRNVKKLLNIIGLDIIKVKKNSKYIITPQAGLEVSEYYKFLGLTCDSVRKQIDKTGYFYLIIKESLVPVDSEVYKILENIGKGKNFFDKLISDERFSLILGACLNFSNNELKYLQDVCGKDFFKKVYRSGEMAMGLYVLSPVIRVIDGNLLLPGGEDARAFWVTMIGAPVKSAAFIKELTTGADGRFNFFFRTTFFMPDKKFSALCLKYSGVKFKEILVSVNLKKTSKIAVDRFPAFRDFNFFSLLSILVEKDGEILFPSGVKLWYRSVAGKSMKLGAYLDNYLMLLEFLAENNDKGRYENSRLKTFVTVYSKFIERQELLTPQVVRAMFYRYSEASILIDYIEKLRIRKPETVMQLFKWYDKLMQLGGSDRELFTALFQSVFEIVSFRSTNSKEHMDYDKLVSEIIAIPFNREQFAANFINLINLFFTDLNRGNPNVTFVNMICAEIPSRILTFEGQKFLFDMKGGFVKEINRILRSQELCTMSQLLKLSELLTKCEQSSNTREATNICRKIAVLIDDFPDPGIADSAPGRIKKRVRQVGQRGIMHSVSKMEKYAVAKEDRGKLIEVIRDVRENYLLNQLRDYLLGVVYAINAKDSRLKPFINPNLVRLHDFGFTSSGTPWNRSEILWERDDLSCFYIAGGLSKLNLLFAECLKDKLFSLRLIYDSAQITSVLNNILWYYRSGHIPGKGSAVVRKIERGLDILEKGREDARAGRNVLISLTKIATGNHYRRVHEYFNLKSDDTSLNLSELYYLGAAGEKSRSFEALGINTFGTLLPLKKRFLPLELARFRKAGWSLGEFIDELQLKVLYSFSGTGISEMLAGEIAYRYLGGYCRRYFRQNYKGDYFNTIAVFDIFNKAIMKNIVQLMKRDGGLRLL